MRLSFWEESNSLISLNETSFLHPSAIPRKSENKYFIGIVLYIYQDRILITRIKAFTLFDLGTFTHRGINLRKSRHAVPF